MGAETALIAGGALGLGGSIISSSSASDAANAQLQAAKQAGDAQLAMYYQSREDVAPWRQAGAWAVNKLAGGPTYGPPTTEQRITGYTSNPQMIQAGERDLYNPNAGGGQPIYSTVTIPGKQTGYEQGLIGKGPGQFIPSEQPGYEFGYQEFIEKPNLRLAAASGKLGSGATLKSLSRYAEDYASTQYDNFLNRYYKSLDPYLSMAGMGQTSAGQTASNAMTAGQFQGQNILGAGQASAMGSINQGNIWGNAAGSMGQNLWDYYYMNKRPQTTAPLAQTQSYSTYGNLMNTPSYYSQLGGF